MFSARRVGACVAVLLLPAASLLAQGESDAPAGSDVAVADDTQLELGRERVDIEPYTGPPVYLPQEEDPPAPSEVSSQMLREKYKDLGTPHFERRLVRYSDNSLVSDGPNREYYASGQLFVEGEFDDSRATGEWTYYHPNGEIAKRVTYVDGLPDGRVEAFSAEGELLSVRTYDDGVRDGQWAEYAYDDGERRPVREYAYKEGKPHGAWKVWYRNGKLRQEQNFADGLRDGLVVEWSRSGEKRAEAAFRAGKRDGETVVYQRDGGVLRKMFKEDRLVGQEESPAE